MLTAVGVVVVMLLAMKFYGGAVKQSCVIELSDRLLREEGGRDVIDSLVLPHIRHQRSFVFYADRLLLWDSLRSGRYELREGMSVVEIVRMLKLGMQSPLNVTFTNARGLEAIAGRLEKQIEADSLTLLECFRSDAVLESVGLKREEIMSLFIPNTYELWWNITPTEFVVRMKLEYDRFWTAARERRREALKMSRVEVSTLASIVMEESAMVDEMPRVAGVYINRLRRGYRLQADPTVRFAIGDYSIKRILHKHLEYKSPYNTYLHRGLPPGPIAVPSIAAIDAVLNYEHHDYLYFCARAEFDGYHNFARTYEQHLKNARLYKNALDSRGVK